MVLCILGIGVFAVLGLFSAKYRWYFRQSVQCLKSTVMLRPCEMELDKKIRAKAASKLSGRPFLAKLVYRHFNIISWIFVILLIVSAFITIESVLNIFFYGTCSPTDPAVCVITGKQ